MNYSDPPVTPTPAGRGKQDNVRGGELESWKEREGDEEARQQQERTPEEGRHRGRKRLRVRSPGEEHGEDGDGGEEVEGEQRRSLGMTPPEDEEREDGPPTRATPERPPTAPPPAQRTEAVPPPPYPTMPTEQECDALIEEVVKEASEALRTKLRALVERARGGVMNADPAQIPTLSQDTKDYWQYCPDLLPETWAMEDVQSSAKGGAGDEWNLFAEGETAGGSTTEQWNPQYPGLAEFLAQFVPDATAEAERGGNTAQRTAAQDQRPPATTELKPVKDKGKGRERAVLMDVDKPYGPGQQMGEATGKGLSWGKLPAEEGTASANDTWSASWLTASPRRTHLDEMRKTYQQPALRRQQATEATTSGGRAQSGTRSAPPFTDSLQEQTGRPAETEEEEAARKRVEALERRMKKAGFAKPIADVEASGQPDHRRAGCGKDKAAAWALWERRKEEIAKLGMAPTPDGHYPAIHLHFPTERVRNVPEAKAAERLEMQEGTWALIDVYGEGDVENTDVRRLSAKLENALKKITGLDRVKLEQPPRTPFGGAKQYASTIWFASGLYPAAVALLSEVHAWPTAEVKFFAYKETTVIPRYLFAVMGFTQDDKDEVRLAIWETMHKEPNYTSIRNLVEKNPDYEGLNADEVTNALISTVEVKIRPVSNKDGATLVTHVYMTTPTRSASVWQSWRDSYRFPPHGVYLNRDEPQLEVSRRLTRCKGCHGADHLTPQCLYAHLDGWEEVQDRPEWATIEYNRAKPPKPNQQAARGEHGQGAGGHRGEETPWMHDQDRGRGGSRGRGTRGGPGAGGSAQYRARRN
ncbi:hypothetical protein OH77DRAFT_1585645 [Trametes cingulata]|nr:hypothetical protein OH77DRAFT_1585645 [Trametes cingulata]